MKRDYLIASGFFGMFALLFLVAAMKCVLLAVGVLTGESALMWGALACIASCAMLNVVKTARRWRAMDKRHRQPVDDNAALEALIRSLDGSP